MTSFFVNLPSNSGPQTFPNNTAATFDTTFDLVRRLDGEWSVALVAMSHPAKINNVVNGFYDVMTFLQYDSSYWRKWQRIHVPDGYYTDSITMWTDMLELYIQNTRMLNFLKFHLSLIRSMTEQ